MAQRISQLMAFASRCRLHWVVIMLSDVDSLQFSTLDGYNCEKHCFA